jgi:hypothetical protein
LQKKRLHGWMVRLSLRSFKTVTENPVRPGLWLAAAISQPTMAITAIPTSRTNVTIARGRLSCGDMFTLSPRSGRGLG